MNAECQHEWRETGITHAVSGRKWQQVAECFYCPHCRQFASKVRWFLDGRFYASDASARRANAEAGAAYVTAKRAWLEEHYPAHAEVSA